MSTYIALTTINYRDFGYSEVTRGEDKKAVERKAREMIGNYDIYDQTKQRNLIVVSMTEARRWGFREEWE